MKKVVYSVTKVGKVENFSMKGVGYITDTDLVIACKSNAGKPYIRVFEDVVKCCHKVIGKDVEFKGAYYEIREVEFERQDGSKEKRKCEINYNIWYKLAEYSPNFIRSKRSSFCITYTHPP